MRTLKKYFLEFAKALRVLLGLEPAPKHRRQRWQSTGAGWLLLVGWAMFVAWLLIALVR